MDFNLFLNFIIGTMVIVVTPGSTVALSSSKAVKYGLGASSLTILGDALGTTTQIIIAVMGLNLFLKYAAEFLPFVQIAGGIYIVYLGIQSILERSDNSVKEINVPSRTGHFISGFFVCVSNPKSIIFFAALFPGFISLEHSIFFQTLVYGTIFIFLDAMFIFSYSYLAFKTVQTKLGKKIPIPILSGIGLGAVGVLLVYNGYLGIYF